MQDEIKARQQKKMSERIYLNNNWKFADTYSPEILESDFDASQMVDVRIPHTVKETPFNYFDEGIYQLESGYRKEIDVPVNWSGKHIELTFEGVAHYCKVYINGKQVMTHSCGYTAFSIDVSDELIFGSKNVISLYVDSRETLNQPPFGFVIDYMTYGGIYRDVYFDISEKSYIKDVFAWSELDGRSAVLKFKIDTVFEKDANCILKQYINEEEIELEVDITKEADYISRVSDIELWDIDHPELYRLKTVLLDKKSNRILDEKIINFGFRDSKFKEDGYYLNGRKIKIRGLNRHQSYAYTGYAMPDSMQILDADILKNELGVNAVRTSHYPQAQAFIDRCDEIGLLVFTEIPGWQHIGDEDWKLQAIQNTEDMVKQYRNHPSVILWGVRINESPDDDDFYERTNRAAHRLDPTRPTGGVRCIKKSNLLEDVYTYNDFVHEGNNAGCERKKAVTSDVKKPYLISEYNGHMYPTKAFDWEEHRREHAIRHANVLDAVAAEEDISGSFGWCMFDYNTHKDFGSGDRICYHGVMDMFRNPKLAALVYECEQEETTVLDISSSMDIGEHPGCNRGKTYIFSNADSVRMYKNDRFIKEYFPKDSEWKNLKHGPILINDFIGDAVDKGEAERPEWARKDLKEAFNATALYGLSKLPLKIKLKAVKLVLFIHMRPSDAVKLYNRYIGDWGGKSTVYKFEAVKNGEVVKVLTKDATKGIHIEAIADHVVLNETKTYDVSAVRIRILDDNANQVSFFNEPLKLEAEGPVEIIGPDVIGCKGGMTGTYIKTKNEAGTARLKISNSQCESVCINFTVGTDGNVKTM